jgi:hypothetical protein
MTTPIPQIPDRDSYPYTYTVFCTADTKFFNETPPTPFAFFLYNLLLFLYKNPTKIPNADPRGVYKKIKKYIHINKTCLKKAKKCTRVALQQLCDKLHKRFQNGTATNYERKNHV